MTSSTSTLALYPPHSLHHLPWFEAQAISRIPLDCGRFQAWVGMTPHKEWGIDPCAHWGLCVCHLSVPLTCNADSQVTLQVLPRPVSDYKGTVPSPCLSCSLTCPAHAQWFLFLPSSLWPIFQSSRLLLLTRELKGRVFIGSLSL